MIEDYENNWTYDMYVTEIKTFGDIYEFGVYGGKSLSILIRDLKTVGIQYGKIFGFDSFIGLPEEDENTKKPNNYGKDIWARGEFSSINLFKNNDIDYIKEYIRKKTDYIPILIEGFFDKTLNEEIVKKYDMKKASYINIDCDLYISAYQALDFIFKYNLWQPGTVIRYDDWYGISSDMGEIKAHNEIMLKYGIKCENLCGVEHLKTIMGKI